MEQAGYVSAQYSQHNIAILFFKREDISRMTLSSQINPTVSASIVGGEITA